MKIVPFCAEHLRKLQVQDAQLRSVSWMPADQAETIQNLPAVKAFTALDGEEVLACAGVLELWEGRATAWAFLSKNVGRRFATIHRAVKRYLDMTDYRRIEAEVEFEFKEGHRWMALLGFKRETERMVAYFPDGSDASMYVKVK